MTKAENEKSAKPVNPALSFVTPDEIRVSYPHVWAPQQMNAQSKPKFGMVLLIPKTATKTLEKIRAGIEAAKVEGKATIFGGKLPAGLKIPLRDGDTDQSKENKPEFKGHFFISANSDTKPPVFDVDGGKMIMQSNFYAGCYAWAAINFYLYTTGSPGIACGLNGVKKSRDGEAFSGKPSEDEVQAMFDETAESLV